MPDQVIQADGERALASKTFREFKGVYTKSDRTQMPENQFYNLENLIPVGPANIHTIPNISAALHDFSTDTTYYDDYVQIGTVAYQVVFATNGKVFSYKWSNGTTTQINVGNLLSGANSRCTQWMNKYVLFIDSSGYYSWDGTTFSKLTGANQPTTGTDIAVAFQRVWILSGRLLTYSTAYDGNSANDPTANTAWLAANGNGFTNFTDPTLSGNATRLWSQNGYLYIFGATCLYAISDLYVPSGASPPTPVYTITNVQAIIGTDQPLSVFAYNRALMFANRYGAWAVEGVNAERISEDIDGTWQYIDFSKSITGGQCVVSNILNASFLIQRLNDPVFGSNTVIGMWFDGVWWFTNFGAITRISNAIINSVPVLVAFIGNKMYTLMSDATTVPVAKVMTPLWSMDDPISAKEVLTAGMELLVSTALTGGVLTVTLDTELISDPLPVQASSGVLQFTGAGGAMLTFTGAASVAIVFTTGTYQLYETISPGGFGHYVGMSATMTNLICQLASFLFDYKKAQRWK